MADPKGFLSTPREIPVRRPVDLRLLDWREVYEPFPPSRLERQAGRCMDCGIPFCHNGCPLGNLIPEWNDLVWRQDWRDAADRRQALDLDPDLRCRLQHHSFWRIVPGRSNGAPVRDHALFAAAQRRHLRAARLEPAGRRPAAGRVGRQPAGALVQPGAVAAQYTMTPRMFLPACMSS